MRKYNTPSPARGNLIMLLLIVFAILMSGLMPVLGLEGFVIQSLFGQVTLLLVPLVAYFLVTKQSPKQVLSMEPVPLKVFGWMAMLTVALIPLYDLLLQSLALVVAAPIKEEVSAVVGVIPFWQLLVVGSLLPGILEELLLRSVFFNEFHKSGGASIGKTAVLVSLFTALMVGNFHLAVPVFLSSILFFYILYYTRNFAVSMLSHLILNAMTFVKFHIPSYLTFSDDLAGGNLTAWLGLIGLSLLAIPVIILYIRKFRGYRQVQSPTFENSNKVITWSYWVAIAILALVMVGNEVAYHVS